MTVKDLLTHTSGLIYGFGKEPIDEIYRDAKTLESPSMDAFVAKLATLPLALPARRALQLRAEHRRPRRDRREGGGHAVRALRGGARHQAARAWSTRRTTCRRPSARGWPRSTRSTRPTRSWRCPRRRLAGVYPEPGRGFAAGGAGMFSTIGDYARFGQMLLNGGELDGVRILGRKTVELMMANHLNHLRRRRPSSASAEGFGLGGSVRIDLAKGDALGSVGQFGWSARPRHTSASIRRSRPSCWCSRSTFRSTSTACSGSSRR